MYRFTLTMALLLPAFGSLADNFSDSAYSTLSSDKNDSSTQIGGVLMLDYALFDGNYRNDTSDKYEFDTELRRARIDVKHKLNKAWKGKLQISFDEQDNSSEIGDAYIQFSGFDQTSLKKAKITIGQMKEPFGLENLTSSKASTFLERSMASNAFAPSRNKGMMLSSSNRNFTWALGAYDIDTENELSDPYSITGRMTWSAILPDSKSHLTVDNQLFHLGLAASWRNLDGDEFEINERAEIHSADKVISSGEIDTDQVNLLGLEAAWVNGSLSLQTEYMHTHLAAVDSSEDTNFNGYYLQSSYFLTGESRNYNKGVFSKVKPLSDLGAWELTARYSVLDAQEASEGNIGQTSTLGLNYYYDENLRLMANLLHSEVSDSEDDGNGLAFRLQYVF